MTIHASNPFATPEGNRSPIRRLRGRLPAPVTIWTAGAGPHAAGLTVSSVLVADGDPGRIAGIIDEESDLWEAMQSSGRAAITLLHQGEHLLADRMAGILPTPGGRFAEGEWVATPYGPVPAHANTWAGVILDGSRPFGYGLLVEVTIDQITVPEDPARPLIHVRGRYRDLSG